MTDLQNRGLNDILIVCVDGWVGFSEAMNTIYPQTAIQLCVIHQICHLIKCIAFKHHKAFMSDLKPVYKVVSRDAAIDALDELEQKWGDKYPIVIQSWRRKWDNLSTYFCYPCKYPKLSTQLT
ncbi:hypothetical protein A9G29_10295 [Gilliamella sp. Fer2-1]|nr:hypothetical protein A9G29_10295 [Gilliamella apicola]